MNASVLWTTSVNSCVRTQWAAMCVLVRKGINKSTGQNVQVYLFDNKLSISNRTIENSYRHLLLKCFCFKISKSMRVFLPASDIDECSTKHSCAHICGNVDGFYQCYCSNGYKLNDDRHTCRESKQLLRSISIISMLCSIFMVYFRLLLIPNV